MVKKSDKDILKDRKLKSFIATFFSIIGFLIAILFWKDDKYVMFYAKQSIIVFIFAIIIAIIDGIFILIPILGGAIIFILRAIAIIFWILSWIYALSGNKKEIPIIGYLWKI